MRKLILVAALVFTGCTHNLQGSFVTCMEDTMQAIELDVRDGHYKPDAASAMTLQRAKQAITDARAVLDSDKE